MVSLAHLAHLLQVTHAYQTRSNTQLLLNNLLITHFLAGLYLVGEKGEKGLPGPPGQCDCDTTVGTNNAPFGSYTLQGGPNKVPAVRRYNPSPFRLNNVYCSTLHKLINPDCLLVDICG